MNSSLLSVHSPAAGRPLASEPQPLNSRVATSSDPARVKLRFSRESRDHVSSTDDDGSGAIDSSPCQILSEIRCVSSLVAGTSSFDGPGLTTPILRLAHDLPLADRILGTAGPQCSPALS